MTVRVEIFEHLDDSWPFTLAQDRPVVFDVPVQELIEVLISGNGMYFVEARTPSVLYDDRWNVEARPAAFEDDRGNTRQGGIHGVGRPKYFVPPLRHKQSTLRCQCDAI